MRLADGGLSDDEDAWQCSIIDDEERLGGWRGERADEEALFHDTL